VSKIDEFKSLIKEYENLLIQNETNQKEYFKLISDISDEVDDKGKSKFSNAEKRQTEAEKRNPELVTNKEKVKIDLTLIPYRIELVKKEIDFELIEREYNFGNKK
jgi:hypothetical protein